MDAPSAPQLSESHDRSTPGEGVEDLAGRARPPLIPPSSPKTNGAIEEWRWAEAAGLGYHKIVEMRHELLEEGVDFERIPPFGKVMIFAGGLAKLEAQIEGRPELVIHEPVPLEFTVVSTPRNLKILVCRDPDGGEVRVRVRSNANFVPGMKVKAAPGREYDDVYDLVGRAPRYRGRW